MLEVYWEGVLWEDEWEQKENLEEVFEEGVLGVFNLLDLVFWVFTK